MRRALARARWHLWKTLAIAAHDRGLARLQRFALRRAIRASMDQIHLILRKIA